MTNQFLSSMQERKEKVDDFLSSYFSRVPESKYEGMIELKKSMEYSLLQNGKRFRPVLSLMVADSFGVGPKQIIPFACAIEMIHTYSLIHDDLPCMDNDDFRRGQPTNHKVFNESVALLAGDALLTEAFSLISSCYIETPEIAIQLVMLLSEAAGFQGMVGGQSIDMKAKGLLPDQAGLEKMHSMKTGALIRVSCEGPALICGLPKDKIKKCRDLGEKIGFAFQLADDLIDSSEGKIEKGSFPDLIGLDETKKLLIEVSKQSKMILDQLHIENPDLFGLIEYNLQRKK